MFFFFLLFSLKEMRTYLFISFINRIEVTLNRLILMHFIIFPLKKKYGIGFSEKNWGNDGMEKRGAIIMHACKLWNI